MLKTIFIASILISCLTAKAEAFDTWSSQDVKLQATYSVLHVLDWMQTLDIKNHRERDVYETNPVLGKHPSNAKINAYMGSTLILNAVVTHILPSKYRPWWQVAGISVEASCVVNNYNLGLRVKF